MELHQLKYFVAAADLSNFTKAAKRCRVAQPSLSQQIIKLETELGRPLFERLGRMVKLTEAGRILLERALPILAAVEEAKRVVVDPAGEEGGIVNVGAIATVAPYLLPSLAAEFRRAFPASAVLIAEDLTARLVEGCLRGDLSLAFLALPVDDPRLEVEILFEEELLLALPAKHALAQKRRPTIQDLDGQPFILLDEMHCLGRQIVSFCRVESCRPFVVCRSAQIQTIQEFISVGHGVSLLPALACEIDSHPGRVYRRLAGAVPSRTLVLIRRKQRYRQPAVDRFVALLRTKAASLRNSKNPSGPAD